MAEDDYSDEEMQMIAAGVAVMSATIAVVGIVRSHMMIAEDRVDTRHSVSPRTRKRVRQTDGFDEIDKLVDALNDLANAMKKSNSLDNTKLLYSEVMKTEGFDELFLESAFDYLNENDKIGRSFLVKSTAGRCRWLKKFQSGCDAL